MSKSKLILPGETMLSMGGGGNDGVTKTITTLTVPAEPEKTEVQNVEDIYKPYFDAEDKRLETEQKRAKRNKLFAGISDGISAIANLYAVSQGAPNQFTPQSALSGKAAERYDNLTKERNANKMAYNNVMYQARRTDKDFAIKKSANQLAALKAQLDIDKYNLDKAVKEADFQIKKAQEKRAQEKHVLEMKFFDGKITKQQYDNYIAQVNANYAEAEKRASLAVKNAQIASAKANAAYKNKQANLLGLPETTEYEYNNDGVFGRTPTVKSKTTSKASAPVIDWNPSGEDEIEEYRP